ncbi:hypothetical protein QC762_204425 [Podospora pseudocomata]|uniref:Uncharacterized protein n=1 Tax=Podospora pseudocomata TaxID=2093779 RepID=A0ABR0GQZ1_9PEZI|nr:hypothetical protein QC762_204425 [Podospora pseudocomata]
MHSLIPTVALLSQSAAVFGAAIPKPAPAAAPVPLIVDNALPRAAVTQRVKIEEELAVEIIEKTLATLVKSVTPTTVAARQAINDILPPNYFWPPFFSPPQMPNGNQTFSPYCHLKTQEECNRIL